MTTRKFDTLTWSDPWFESLKPTEKLLFIYFWTNDVCNQAGMYHISRRRIEFETGVKLDGNIESLFPKVEWFPDKEVVWIKKFTDRQSQNKQFVESALKCAEKFNGYRDRWITFNEKLLQDYGVEYQPPLNHPSTHLEPPSVDQDQISSDEIEKGVQPPVEPPPKKKWVYKKKTTIPHDFHLTHEMSQFAKAKSYSGNIEEFTEKFIRQCQAKGYEYKDFTAAWKNWLMKDLEENPQKSGEVRYAPIN